jgi:thiol-disulfide isomerase/thioredoxin
MKIKPLLLLACLFSAIVAQAQGAAGIHFEDGLSWQQILTKAKTENKPIFLDCYTTWCAPCKAMDQKTYTDASVGEFLNSRFLCVKVQMDRTAKDGDPVKAWYADAAAIEKQYAISAYPTFLFFSPERTAVHKGVGFKDPKQFVALAQAALDPAKQYYTLLESYQQGKCAYSVMPTLSDMVGRLGDQELSDAIARDYMEHYVDKLDDVQLLNKATLEFAEKHMNSGDKVFALFLHQPNQVDEVLGAKDAAQEVADSIITREEITSKLYIGKGASKKAVADNPNWEEITATIARKYGQDCAERTVLDAKIGWCKFTNDWTPRAKLVLDQLGRYGIDLTTKGNANALNNRMFQIFSTVDDPAVLTRAVGWQRKVLETKFFDQEDEDTLANLLYKAGRSEEAITWEEKALQDEEAGADKEKRKADPVYQATLDKMRQGKPTWGNS